MQTESGNQSAAQVIDAMAVQKPALQFEHWYEAVDALAPYIVKISTPVGFGSGFLLSWGSKTNLCAIATAAHVIEHAHYWEEPIRIEHALSGETMLVRQERAIFIDAKRDTATIVIDRGRLPLPAGELKLVPEGKSLKVGNRIGWLGFPAITNELCFFRGCISAWIESTKAYWVDGVAINGVSGGPAFFLNNRELLVVGVVSAYLANRQSGDALPGLAMVRDISQFHEVAPQFASMDEARAKQTVPMSPPPPPASEPSAMSSR